MGVAGITYLVKESQDYWERSPFVKREHKMTVWENQSISPFQNKNMERTDIGHK